MWVQPITETINLQQPSSAMHQEQTARKKTMVDDQLMMSWDPLPPPPLSIVSLFRSSRLISRSSAFVCLCARSTSPTSFCATAAQTQRWVKKLINKKIQPLRSPPKTLTFFFYPSSLLLPPTPIIVVVIISPLFYKRGYAKQRLAFVMTDISSRGVS